MSSDGLLWADYVVFVIFVIISIFVAVYSRFFGIKQNTKADFVFATSKVSMGAMMLSIARGTLGVRTFLGSPSELYYHGAEMWETLYGMVAAYPIVCFVFVPVYFNIGITSVYQYLDMRFKSRLVRCIASGTYIVRQLFNQGVTVFTPCVALYSIVGIPYWVSIFGISAMSVVFTLLGGLKSAIQSDVLQGITMIILSVAIFIQGCIEAGGFGTVFEISKENGRLNFFNWNPDPTVRVTTISATVGQLFMSLSIFGCQQSFVQRYCSMKSQKEVTKTLMYNIPLIIVLFSLSWFVGIAVYATYALCDPLSNGSIEDADELLPYFMEDRFAYLPGIIGLFMASLFNGALTLNVSNINSLATVTFEDFLRPLPRLRDINDSKQLLIIRAICVVYGFVIMGISFAIGLLDGVIESYMLVTSATSGPLLALFVMAILIPYINGKGAAIGAICGHIITLWITFGGLTLNTERNFLPLSTEGCPNKNFSTTVTPITKNFISYNEVIPEDTNSNSLELLYSVTYMYYSLIGCFSSILVALVVSAFTKSKRDTCPDELIHPIVLKICKCTTS